MLRRFLISMCLAAVCSAAVPRPVADVPIPTTDGKKINLKQYRGKVVLFTMFLTTCTECIRSIDLYSKMQKEFGPRGFQVVAAALDSEDGAAKAASFVARYRPSFPVGYLDPAAARKIGDMAPDFHPTVPAVFFVDSTGTVRIQYYAEDAIFKQEEKAFRAIVDSLLKKAAQDAATAKKK